MTEIGTEPVASCSQVIQRPVNSRWARNQSPVRFWRRAIAIAFGGHSQKSTSIVRVRAMKANDLRSMSVDELWTLHEEISAILAKRLAEEKAALEERLRRLNPERVTGTFQRAKRPYPQVLPKFRNPARPGETWSGRGKQPRWLTAQLRSGKKINDFLIQPSSSSARRSSNGRKHRRA